MGKRKLFGPKPASIELKVVAAEVTYLVCNAWIGVEVQCAPGVIADAMRSVEEELGIEYVPVQGTVDDQTLLRGCFDDRLHLKAGDWLYGDIFALREAFEGIKSKAEFVKFLSESGPFRVLHRITEEGQTWHAVGVSWSEFKVYQEHFRRWRLDGTRGPAWLLIGGLEMGNNPMGHLRVKEGSDSVGLQFEYRCRSVLGAVAASISFDLLRGVRWRECPNCGNLVVVDSRPEKNYCSQLCRSTYKQRRRRARERSSEAAES